MEYFGDDIEIDDQLDDIDEYGDFTEEEIGFGLCLTPDLIKSYTTPAYQYLLHCTLECWTRSTS